MSSPHSSDSEDDIPAIRDKEDQEEEDGVEATSRQGQGQGSGIDLTGFLFGNIDEEGRLSEDSASFLDRSTREKLGGLSRLLSASGGALGVPVAGAGEGDDEDDDYDLDKIVQEGSAGQDKEEGGEKAEEEAFDGTQKAPDAQDFSAIEDAMSDDSSSSDEDSQNGDAEKAKVEDDKEQQQKLAESAEEKPSTEVKKETEDSVAEVKEEPMEVEEREEAAKSTESTAEAQGKDAEDVKEEKVRKGNVSRPTALLADVSVSFREGVEIKLPTGCLLYVENFWVSQCHQYVESRCLLYMESGQCLLYVEKG